MPVPSGRNIVIGISRDTPVRLRATEICEHKGIGHPDTITDAVCEAASRALSQAYLDATGAIQHHNVDKGLLVAGQSAPRFGGGEWRHPIRLIVCGRATPLPHQVDPAELAAAAARHYLERHLHCDPGHFEIETAIRPGSASLNQVYRRARQVALANDTSFGVGYAPYSPLEQAVLKLADSLKSTGLRSCFPAIGDDFKIMGVRSGSEWRFTVALAFIDRYVDSVAHYFALKREICDVLGSALDQPAQIALNTLDDPDAREESGLYLTVSGLSAEMGDDGQVGRGNRANGLITPCRPMSLEATAGKNPAAHVGKLYNVLARLMAEDIAREMSGAVDVHVRLVSTIGHPVDQPQLAEVELLGISDMALAQRARLHDIVDHWLDRSDQVVTMILQEQVRLF